MTRANLPLAPTSLFGDDGTLREGVYRSAVDDPQLPAHPWRLKEWQYLSVTSPTWFLGLALVQTGYVANLFAYWIDRASPATAWQVERLSPLGRAVTIAAGSLHGTSRWQGGGQRVEVTASTAADGQTVWNWQLDLRLTSGDKRHATLKGTLQVGGGEALALVHALPGGRPAYTHKEAGQRVVGGSWTWRDEGGAEQTWQAGADGDAWATLDWTRSLALRHTRWNWASAATQLGDGRRFGLNLSAHVYDDARGHSRENALWLDGAVCPLGGVRFALPADPQRAPWRIHSLQGDGIDLVFTPYGARRQHLELGLVASRFVQPWGEFSGYLRTSEGERLQLDRVWGVVEDHHARW